jgi:hypothetical protein
MPQGFASLICFPKASFDFDIDQRRSSRTRPILADEMTQKREHLRRGFKPCPEAQRVSLRDTTLGGDQHLLFAFEGNRLREESPHKLGR